MDFWSHYKSLSLLYCALLLASASHPHIKKSSLYITLTLHLKLSHTRSSPSNTNVPLMTNNHKRTVSEPRILSLPSTSSRSDPTLFLHRTHYVSTPSSPATLVNGRTLQTLIKSSAESHYICGLLQGWSPCRENLFFVILFLLC